MNLLTSPMVERVGWVLLHSTWLLSIPTALFATLLWLTPQKFTRLRYLAGVAVLALMALLPLLSFPFIEVSVRELPSIAEASSRGASAIDRNSDRARPSFVDESESRMASQQANAELRDMPDRSPSVPATDVSVEAVVIDTTGLPGGKLSDEPETQSIGIKVEHEPSPAWRDSLGALLHPYLSWAVVAWVVGVSLMSIRLLTGWSLTRRLRRRGTSDAPEDALALFTDLKKQIGGCAAARLVQSTLVSVPSIVGHFRPVVLLPVTALTGLSEQQLRAILAHELAHVKRYDYLINICQSVVETLLFYHPAVWWVSRRVRIEREHCCDDVAIRHGCQASELARALITVDSIRRTNNRELLDSVLISAADGGDLLRRVRRLAGETTEEHVAGRSWVAGCLALGLILAMLLSNAASLESVAQEGNAQASDRQEPTASTSTEDDSERNAANSSRIDFADGYFVELVGIGDESEVVWSPHGNVIKLPQLFNASDAESVPTLGDAKTDNEHLRTFHARCRMPSDSSISLEIDGGKESIVNIDKGPSNVELDITRLASLPSERKSVDVSIHITLPAWRTLASFDFAGGVKNGVIMDWERKVTPMARYTASGEFGPDATKDNTRIIAFDQQHRQLEAAQTSGKMEGGKLSELKAAFKIDEGRPWFVVVQRRIETQPIVFRDVPLRSGGSPTVRVEVPRSDFTDAEENAPAPVTTLLKEPFGPLSATLAGAGELRLVSIREASNEAPGWHADGSPRLVRARGESLFSLRPSTDDDHRKLEVDFEFIAASPDVRIGRVQIAPEDGSGSTSWKAFHDEKRDVPAVRLQQSLNILVDRETEDFEVDVFAGPLSELATFPVVEPPADFADKSWLGYQPAPETKNIAFHINEPKETKSGMRHVLAIILPEKAPEGSVLTAMTTDGETIEGFTNSTSDRKILGTFLLPSGKKMKSIEVSTQPRHSMVFRNVSVWRGLGSSAFVDFPKATVIDFDSITPSRVFLLPSGQWIAEQDGEGVGISPALQALSEIERRGGLFRFDEEGVAPSGETLPYLTEIRWRDYRADELRWIHALSGLTRLELSSEYTTDDSLRSLKHLSTLTELEISRSRHLTTDCLQSVGQLTELRELQLYGGHLEWNDEGYDANDFANLRTLEKIVEWEPFDWRMDDAGIAWLKSADDLQMVYGWGPAVTDVGFAALANKPKLGVIHLGTTQITDASFKMLENHPQLYWLQCSSPNLTDAAIDSLLTMSKLRKIHLYESRVTDAGVRKLADAIDRLPRLEVVDLSSTAVSQEVAESLRKKRDGLRVIVSPPASSDGQEQQEKTSSDTAKINSATAPQDAPWPDKSWTKSLPASGSGLRVKLDERRWVEFNSVYAIRESDEERSQIHWTADGVLIDPPEGFDPKSLVPNRDGDDLLRVTRGFLMQVVGPEGTRVALSTSGFGGYGTNDYPLDGPFVQIPLDTIATRVEDNHAYAEVKVSREVKELISLDDSRLQIITDPETRKVFVAIPNARDYAWRLMIDQDGEAIGQDSYLVGGRAESALPEDLRSSLKEEFRQAQVIGFAFDEDQPMPKLVCLEQAVYDVVRFDNLSVYPGPRSAVVVTVNGTAIDERNRVELSSLEELGDDVDLDRFIDKPEQQSFETVKLTGSVVDENGKGVNDCWVGLFIEPQEHHGQSRRAPAWAKQPLSTFGDGPPLAVETRTNSSGEFTFDVPKTHFVFEGVFWAVKSDGTLASKWHNAVWSYVRKPENLRIAMTDDRATVRVVDPNGEAVTEADVTLEAIRIPRSVTRRLPEAVQKRLKPKTDQAGQVSFGGIETAAIRGIAVSTEKFGTQFLNDSLASTWVRGDEPLTLKLQPTASLSGRVIDFDSQRDAGLMLKARTEQSDDRPPMNGRSIAEVRSDGTFRFDKLSVGYVSLESSLTPDSARKIRFASIATLEAGEDRVLDAARNPTMVDAVLVRQRLIESDTGEGVPGSQLRVLWGDAASGDGHWRQSQALKTDAQGWWLTHVLPGIINVRLGTLPDGYRSTAWFDGRNGRLGIEANIPASDKLVTIPPERYAPALEIEGRLVFADGSPAEDWSVYGHPISWMDVGVGGVQTSKDGSFTLTYPTGYPPRFFNASNRQWMTQHNFADRYVVPKVRSDSPLVLEIPNVSDAANAKE
ncbi:MAG: M56 family metallopeptidase [Pirellulaceae bacterium]